MKTDKFISLIAIVVLMATIFIQRSCQRCPECPEATHSSTEVWFYDTARIVTRIPVPYPVKELVPVNVPAVIDSLAVFKAYYTRFVFDRILKDDSTAFVRVIDTLSQNKFTGSSMEFINRRPTQIITHTTTLAKPVNKVFVGPMVGATMDGKLAFGGSAVFVSKRDNAYGLTVDPFARRVEVSSLWKISFRKK